MTINLPFVMEFVIYLTNRCNLACEMCSQYGENFKENAPQELSLEDWEKFLLDISDTNPKPKIILMGGEPLLYKNFDKLFQMLQDFQFPVHIVTNGTLLDKYLELLANSDITITISIDGLEEKHDKIRGKQGTFRKVIENIKLANKMQGSGAKFKLYVNSVILPDNVNEMSNFIEYMQQFNIEQFVFQHLQFSSREMNSKTNTIWKKDVGCEFNNETFLTKKSYSLTTEYVNQIKNNLSKLSRVCRRETFVFPYLNDTEMESYYSDTNLDKIRPYFTCTTPWLCAFISPDGYVSNCIQNTIGNIKDNDFWTLWNNNNANKIRNALCKNGSFEFCKKCCNFYKSHFLLAPNGEIKIDNKTLVLPSELNYLKACPDGVFVLDKTIQVNDNKIPVIPVEVHSKQQLEEIKMNETIVNYFSDIKGGSNEN